MMPPQGARCTLAKAYSPKCLEEGFCELRLYRVLGSSRPLASASLSLRQTCTWNKGEAYAFLSEDPKYEPLHLRLQAATGGGCMPSV